MKKQRPMTKKSSGKPSKKKQQRNPPAIAVGWGRGASEYRPGLFTKQYFENRGEACAADIYRALSEEMDLLNEKRIEIGEKPIRRPNYSSFSRYFYWFYILGLIERTDRSEPAIYNFLKKRVFYRLTSKGKAEEQAWQDPVRAAHPEFG
jgi:ADP-ribose pyrophosphatase YjhB (NUDIX family)